MKTPPGTAPSAHLDRRRADWDSLGRPTARSSIGAVGWRPRWSGCSETPPT